jgi:uncharacterized protein YdiU (UPF0061 family)
VSDSAGWRFDNSYARLPAPFFSRLPPAPVRAPGLVVVNEALAETLGLDAAALATAPGLFTGNHLPPGADPIAQAYAGHQYGHFVNLGDGRAILLGEQIAPDGRRHDIQLKGSGRTPYSRQGDGRAALGPMLREYVIGEAMHALGIPTTRALAVATTGEVVRREVPLPGAVLTRVAASHIRVGTFQFAAALGDPLLLPALLEHAIARHDPASAGAADPALAFLDTVIGRQADLVARWLTVGFVHGVLNTDNCAVSGETIDYGPCAFLDTYDPATVFSSIDHQGRYAHGNQPTITHWNLARLAESLLPVIGGGDEAALEAASGVLATFPDRFRQRWLAAMRAKLGLFTAEEGDGALAEGLLVALAEARADYTESLATLADRLAAEAPPPATAALDAWEAAWRARLARQPQSAAEGAELMRRSNPQVIPRNHLVEEALAAAVAGDLVPLERLVAAVRQPFLATPENARYRQPPTPGGACYRTFCGT